jgi:putative transposase
MHVTQRGNNRQDIFFQDNDRLVYLAILRDLLRLRRCALHAYCLMTNHVHLLLTPTEESGPSLMMRDLARCYASYFNRRYARTGQLWEGRFRSCLVDSAAYVIGCYRYIELNPVRALMVTSPAEHPWSSYAGNAAVRADPLLTAHEEYVALGLKTASRALAYAGLVGADDHGNIVSAIRDATESGFPLVGERLRATLEARGMRLQRAQPGPRAADDAVATVNQLDLLIE